MEFVVGGEQLLLLLLLLVAGGLGQDSNAGGECLLHLSHKSRDHYPFFMANRVYNNAHSSLYVSDSTPKFVYPVKSVVEGRGRLLVIRNHETLIIFCTGKHNAVELTGEMNGRLSCHDGQLELDDWEVSWSDCRCRHRNKSHVRRSNTQCGLPSHTAATVHAIGWKLTNTIFIPHITVCFDHNQETTLYVTHRIMGSSLRDRVTDGRRPGFKKGHVFQSKVHRWYKRSSQRQTVEGAFGMANVSHARSTRFLSRGHLSPDGDYALLAEQDATYYYSNVVPQWQSINNANWKNLEGAVRDLAASGVGRSLLIYTGTLLGALRLPILGHSDTSEVFLEPTEQRLPVPAVLWKVVYDRIEHSAVAVLQINSVSYQGDLVSQLSQVASDVCHLLPWVDWDTTDPAKGFTFCWRAEDIARIVPYAPSVDVLQLLIN